MNFLHRNSLLLLRLSLGVTFFWFGLLKLFNSSPAIPMIQKALPESISAFPMFILILALIEIGLGLAFLSNKFVKIAAIISILHLLVATGSVLITQGFNPWFPVLSLAGEFVVKNLVLMAAAVVLISEKAEKNEAQPEGK